MKKKKLLIVISAILVLLGIFLLTQFGDGFLSSLDDFTDDPYVEATASAAPTDGEKEDDEQPTNAPVDEEGWYDSRDEVALYIHTYGKLPGNYITKAEAEDLGWSGGSLEPYAPGKSIGGSHFGNYEELLPTGRNYKECDIDTIGKSSRGAKRIIYSDDGLIYYTDDHYESFTLLYGNEG